MPQVDVSVENHGTIFLFVPHSQAAKEWIESHISEPSYFGMGLVVETRYATELAEGMIGDGLILE